MLEFSKYTGAGNDFVVVDAADLVGDPAGTARRICPRSSGVGVDGMALVERTSDAELRVRFFNPDGSEFGTCGNGTRCAARWAADRGMAPGGRVRLVTDHAPIEARVSDADVTLAYRIDAGVEAELSVPFPGGERTGWLVRIGTPHFVLPLDEMPRGTIEEICRPVRSHPVLGPGGANVDLVALREPGRGSIRTFERGVEGETGACGSGAMGAAFALRAAGRADARLELETRSGALLTVELEPGFPPPDAPAGEIRPRDIRLTGPARGVFLGRFPEEGERPLEGTVARGSRGT